VTTDRMEMKCGRSMHARGVDVDRAATACPVCDRPRCRARAKGTGERCRRSPRAALATCVKHVAGNPASRSASERRLAEAEACRAIAAILHNPDARPVDEPLDELAKLTGTLRDAVEVAGARMNALTALPESGARSAERAREAVTLWQQLLSQFRSALADMAKQNVDELHVRVTERQATILAQGLTWLLQQLAVAGPDVGDGLVGLR